MGTFAQKQEPDQRNASAKRARPGRARFEQSREAHVQRAMGNRALKQVQRKERQGEAPQPPKMSVSGDAERKSPAGGVPVGNGTLDWELKFSGKDNKVTVGDEVKETEPGRFEISPGTFALGQDVVFKAGFTPAASSTCPTVTFVQTVRPTTDGLWDTGPLLYTRSPTTNASVDVTYDASKPETEPFYGATPKKKGAGLTAETSLSIAGSHPGASARATMADAPFLRTVPKGKTAIRQFETAAICAETAETFGSIRWGYSKTGAGVIKLLGGTQKDVHSKRASAGFETTRRAFYSGFFQLSLGGFATGSAALTPGHKKQLDAVDTRDLTRVILVGANDNSGGAEAKPELSLERARAARGYLVKSRKVKSSLIKAEGHGVEARVPNPPGTAVAANRRVDVHLQRGAETAKPAHTSPASPADLRWLDKRNPRLTVEEVVDTIVRLDTSSGTVSTDEWIRLTTMLKALATWRLVDPTIPDIRKLYRSALRRIKRRTHFALPPARLPMPATGPISPEVDEAWRMYQESKRRVDELKRERDQKLRDLEEERRRVLEE